MKLPRELRDRVYGFYIDADGMGTGNDVDGGDGDGTPVIYPKPTQDGRRVGGCTCAQHEQLFHWQRPAIRAIAPALVSKQMRDEFLGRFYARCVSWQEPRDEGGRAVGQRSHYQPLRPLKRIINPVFPS